jgi:predicted dehydrogenase
VTTASPAAQTADADRPLKVAVVGAGAWGEQHARIFAGRPDTQLVAVAGRTPEKTRARAERHGAAGFTDLDRMIDETSPDLVTVCLPNEDHFDTTLLLIEKGVPLLVEKPLVFDLDEAETLISAAEHQDLFFAINFNHRYAEPVRRAKRSIDDGELGDLSFLTWRFGGEANVGASPHGNLIETQCHGFDLLEHLGGPITSVAAEMTGTTHGSHSTVAIAVAFRSGAVGTMLGSYDSSYAYPDSQLVEVNGSRGRLAIHDTVRRLELSFVGDEVRHVWEAGYFNDDARAFRLTFDRHVDELLAALRQQQPPPVHARAGARALQLAHACIESFTSGRRVGVPPPRREVDDAA